MLVLNVELLRAGLQGTRNPTREAKCPMKAARVQTLAKPPKPRLESFQANFDDPEAFLRDDFIEGCSLQNLSS
jgi:hypothetical protein